MRALRVLAVIAACGLGAASAFSQETRTEPSASFSGQMNGKVVQPNPDAIDAGADATAKLLAGSNLVTFLTPGQPIDKKLWQEQAEGGIVHGRPYLRTCFTQQRHVEGPLNGTKKSKYAISEVVIFFDPNDKSPVILWARDGDTFYCANQLHGHEDLLKWLAKVQGR